MIYEHILLMTFLNKPGLILFGTQLNGFKYCYLIKIILFIIDHLLAHSEVVTSIAIHYQFYSTHSQMFPSIVMLY